VNFNQWKTHAEKSSVAKVTYCCGDQTALVEIVVDDIRRILDVPATDYVEVSGSSEELIWDALAAYPLDPSANRLILVRDCDQISDWTLFFDWFSASRGKSSTYLLLVSYASDAPCTYVKGKKSGYVEHIEFIKSKGKLIKCSQPNEEDLLSWAQSYGLSQASAQHLIHRVAGDTSSMLDVFRKVHLWRGSPNTKVIDLLCEDKPLDSFVDNLLLGDKKAAAKTDFHEEDFGKVINQLDKRLDVILEITKYVVRRVYPSDIATSTGINVFIVKKYTPLVKDYNVSKIKQRRQLLAILDSKYKEGVKEGLWEVLIALW